MDFGDAIRSMKADYRVSRSGWNGKGMYLFLATGGEADSRVEHHLLLPFIVMRTAQGDFVPWLASQTDMLAEDWTVIK